MQLGLDDEGSAFIEDSLAAPYADGWVYFRSFLSLFCGRYSADAVLDMSRMFVLSTKHWMTLCHREHHKERGRMLDVGAGDGHITQRVVPLFKEATSMGTPKPAWP